MLAKGSVLKHLSKLKQRNVILCTSKCNYNFSVILNRKLSTKNEKCVNETEIQGVSECETSSRETDIKQLLEEAAVCSDPPPDNPENVWSTSPYPEGVLLKRDQSRHFRKPNIDPRETSIIMFPGQGTQFVGMGKDLMKFPIARDLFDAASDLLGYNLRELCFNGPKEELDKTIYCQPAVMVCSLAAIEKLKEERPMAIESCVATAGFSIGEITALVFAGALSFEEAIRLVKVRAEAMQLASEIVPSGMMTVFYGPDSKLNYACLQAREWCLQRGIENPECCVANYLYPQCKVVAGHLEALKFIQSNAEQYKLKRLKKIPVSGAFHTSLMRPAVEPFKMALRKVEINDPIIQVFSNVDGKSYRNAHHIRMQLPKQIYKAVKWEQTLHVLYERKVGEYFPRTFECGPGNSLKSLVKMVNAKAWDSCFSIEA